MAEYNIAERAYRIADGSIGLCLTPAFGVGAYAFLKADELLEKRSGEEWYSPSSQATVAALCLGLFSGFKVAEGITGRRLIPQ